MKLRSIQISSVLALLTIAVVVVAVMLAFPSSAVGGSDYVHGIVITVDGEDYYLAGAPDGPGGAFDIPGHTWIQTAPTRLLGRHYNTGPFGAPSWWSSDGGDGALLYTVEGIIDTWSSGKAGRYAMRGYVHYHELIRVDNGEPLPRKVVWLRHTPVGSFTFDGGPHAELAHPVDAGFGLIVYEGVDYQFIPNYFRPYGK